MDCFPYELGMHLGNQNQIAPTEPSLQRSRRKICVKVVCFSMVKSYRFCALLLCLVCSEGLPVSHLTVDRFLQRFGYVSQEALYNNDRFGMVEAIRKYQTFFNVAPSGNLNSQTLALMNAARCGLPDQRLYLSTMTRANWFLPASEAPKFQHKDITWKITEYPQQVDEHTTEAAVNAAVSAAFNMFSNHCSLRFFRTTLDHPDFELKFQDSHTHDTECGAELGNHTIAHYITGSRQPAMIHLNNAFQWTTNRDDSRVGAIPIDAIVAHELGHAFGLAHRGDPSSVMYPNLAIDSPTYLNVDDIAAIRQLYDEHTDASRLYPSSDAAKVCPSAVVTTSLYQDSEQWFHVCAVLYDYDSCGGDSFALPAGYWDLNACEKSSGGSFANHVSSVQINSGCAIRMCTSTDNSGTCVTYPGGRLGQTVTYLDSYYDNNILSVNCTCG